MWAGRVGVLLALAIAAAPAKADENQDLELVPQGITEPSEPGAAPAPAGVAGQRIYLENAATISSLRHLAVPQPPPLPPDWQERLFLDVRREWTVGEGVSLAYSGRLNFRAQNDIDFPSHENIRHDFREGYLSWEALPHSYLDAGRINLKSGVAAGFNPTDFFKTRAVVEPISIDPAVLREDRLGTLMARGQQIWNGGAFTAAFAPALYQPSRLFTNTDLPSFDPMLDRTNAHDRLLLKGSIDVAEDFSPELLLYRQGNRTQFGANLTKGIGQSTILYAEWAGGKRASLIEEALTYGRQTGSLPPNAPSVIPVDTHRHFQNDLSAGASYTTETKITFNLEYHFHQAGMSRSDWDNWFRVGQANARFAPVPAELWYIRGYAAEQQEPTSVHAIFLRADWVDAVVPSLELTGFINTNLPDGSSLMQVTADYYLSSQWTVGALAAASVGTRRSEFGSLPQGASFLVKIVRYF